MKKHKLKKKLFPLFKKLMKESTGRNFSMSLHKMASSSLERCSSLNYQTLFMKNNCEELTSLRTKLKILIMEL